MKFFCFLSVLVTTAIFLARANVECPGGQYQCPDGTTCCRMTSGQFGCCPMVKAVCCADHVHCCPHNTRCDLTHQRCIHTNGHHVRWSSKTVATETTGISESGNKVTCPDHTSACPDGSTCCRLASGQYGCCPMPKAVCCTDHVHCCPHGTTCDLSRQSCDKGDGTYMRWSVKSAAQSLDNGVVCPDGQSECPSGATCCRLTTGQWGCCPIPHAVCCSDNVHCCPHSSRCDIARSRCIKQDLTTVPWMGKYPSRPARQPMPRRNMCPDDVSSCPDTSTCCRSGWNGWRCCPHVDGVCCTDQQHCCPRGTHCDILGDRCIVDGAFMVHLSNVFGSNTLEQARSQQKQCLDGSYCPTPGTCCRQRYRATYTCCAIPNAVCCGSHCCPGGYRCARGPGAHCIKDAKYRQELAFQDSSEENSLAQQDETD